MIKPVSVHVECCLPASSHNIFWFTQNIFAHTRNKISYRQNSNQSYMSPPLPSFSSSQLLTRSKMQIGGQFQNITKHSTTRERGSNLHSPGANEENYILLLFPLCFGFFFSPFFFYAPYRRERGREGKQRSKIGW